MTSPIGPTSPRRADTSRTTGELRDPALEATWLEATLPETRRRVRVCWLIVCMAALAYVFKDSLSLSGDRLLLAGLLRVLSVLPGFFSLVLWPPPTAVALQRRALWSSLAFIPVFVGGQYFYDEISLMSPMWFAMLLILNGLWLAHSFRNLLITNGLIFVSGVLSFALLTHEPVDRVVGVTVLQVAALAFSIFTPVFLMQARRLEVATLLRAFPASVVGSLVAGKSVSEHHDAVTVIFADVVGFTSLAERTPAKELLPMLAEMFLAFDELCYEAGVEPIKTIGDCYMAAAGVPVARADHVEAAARLALSMQRVMAERVFGGQRLRLRVGLHAGPLVAGVVGARRQLYDLWGDTVNVASRLESQGLPGEIQVSDVVAAKLRGAFHLEPRGRVELRGREAMEAWLLKGEAGVS